MRIGALVILQVKEKNYQDEMTSSHGSMEKEVDVRLGSAVRMVAGVSKAGRSTKLEVVNATMGLTLLYNCDETWYGVC